MNNFDYKNMTPFKWFVLENFPFIENDFEAINNYRLFSKVVEYLNKIIDNVNVLGNLVEQFSDYFDNLDVQEEINQKLDEMVESGYFDNLLNNYLNLIRIYDTTENMILDAENIVIGQTIKTLGYHEVNDFGANMFTITDNIDTTKFQITLSSGKYATMISKKSGYVEQFGLDTIAFQNALKYLDIVYLQKKTYTLDTPIILKANNQLIGEGDETIITVSQNFNDFKLFYNVEDNSDNIVLKDFKIDLDGIDFGSSNNVIPRGHIAIKNSNNVKIQNITDTQTLLTGNSDNEPIWFMDCSNIIVEGCNIYHYGVDYTGKGGAVWIFGNSKNNSFVTIKNNKFFVFGDEPIGFMMRNDNCSYSNINIENNDITSLSSYCLTFTKNTSYSVNNLCYENVIIQNNKFTGGGFNFLNALINNFEFKNNIYLRKRINNTIHINQIIQFNTPKAMNNFILKDNKFINEEVDNLNSITTFPSQLNNLQFINNTVDNFYNGININNTSSKIVNNNFSCTNINVINSNQKNIIENNKFNVGIGISMRNGGLLYSKVLSNRFENLPIAVEFLKGSVAIGNDPSYYDNNELLNCDKNFVVNAESTQITPKQLLTNNKLVATNDSILVEDLSSTSNLAKFTAFNNYRYKRSTFGWAEINIT